MTAMKTLITSHRSLLTILRSRSAFILIALTFACFALPPTAEANDRNTKLGKDALKNNTTGSDNTAVGFDALFSNTTGSKNTAIGANALLSNTTGGANTAVGFQALGTISSGNFSTAMGFKALANSANSSN